MSGRKTLPFQMRWQKALLKTELDPASKLVGCAIAAHMDRYGRAWPSKEVLARFCSRRVRTVDRAVKRLQAAGWVEVQPSSGRNSNRYQGLLEPVPYPVAGDGVQKEWNPVTGDGVHSVAGEPNPVAGDGVPRSPNPVTGDRIEKRVEKVPNPVTGDAPTPSRVTHEVNQRRQNQEQPQPPQPHAAVGNSRRHHENLEGELGALVASSGWLDGDVPEELAAEYDELCRRAATGSYAGQLDLDKFKAKLDGGERSL